MAIDAVAQILIFVMLMIILFTVVAGLGAIFIMLFREKTAKERADDDEAQMEYFKRLREEKERSKQ